MSTSSTIRRTRWDLYVDALAAGQRWWLEERPTQRASTGAVNRTRRMRGGYDEPPPEAAPAPAAPSATIDYDELAQLGKLHADGTLTDEEFAAAKAKILGT